MSKNKYEIEPVYFGDNMHHETIIGLLTGLGLDEINIALKVLKVGEKNAWYTRDYIRVFQKLGFNTNPRFKPFDPETQYPCIMRCKIKPDDGYWYGWVYNDNTVFDTHGTTWTLKEWIEQFKNKFRVTSMLQVWI